MAAERPVLPCPFERAQLARCALCRLAHASLLAEREAIGCTSAPASERCRALYAALRASARFALHADVSEPWPVSKETRLQCGGLRGLHEALAEPAAGASDSPDAGPSGGPIEIDGLIEAALARHGAVADLPYGRIMRAIVAFQPRRRSPR